MPIDGVAFIALLLFLDIHNPKTPFFAGIKAIDWVGTVLVVGSTCMFLIGLNLGGVTYFWNSAIVICLILFGVSTLAALKIDPCLTVGSSSHVVPAPRSPALVKR